MDDRVIVRLLFDRAEEGLVQLKSKYGRMGMSIARNVLHDEEDAKECVNDALLAVWNTIPPRDPTHLCAYFLECHNDYTGNIRHAVGDKPMLFKAV